MDNGLKDSERKNLKGNAAGGVQRQDTISEFENERDTYQKEFGGFEPAFRGQKVGYYPNSIVCYIIIVLSMLPVYFICGGALVGQVYLATNYGEYFSYGCAALLGFYIFVLIIIVFWGSSGRLALERAALEERRKEQEQEHAAALKLRKDAEEQALGAKKENDNTKL